MSEILIFSTNVLVQYDKTFQSFKISNHDAILKCSLMPEANDSAT